MFKYQKHILQISDKDQVIVLTFHHIKSIVQVQIKGKGIGSKIYDTISYLGVKKKQSTGL